METPNPSYSCRLQPLQPEYSFTLTPAALVVERAGKTARISYRDIESVRLSFLPRGLHATGFRTHIRAVATRPAKFDDGTFTTGFLQERRSADYRAFVMALVSEVRKNNPRARIFGGRPQWLQYVTALFGGAFSLALLLVAWRASMGERLLSGVMLATFALIFAAWTWRFVQRNQPCEINGVIPEDLLPPGA